MSIGSSSGSAVLFTNHSHEESKPKDYLQLLHAWRWISRDRADLPPPGIPFTPRFPSLRSAPSRGRRVRPGSLSIRIFPCIASTSSQAIVGLSFCVRRTLAPRGWRMIHYPAFVAFFFALIHGAASGTDGGQPWAVLLYAFTGGTVMRLTAYRVLSAMGAKPKDLLVSGGEKAVIGGESLSRSESKRIPNMESAIMDRIKNRHGRLLDRAGLFIGGTNVRRNACPCALLRGWIPGRRPASLNGHLLNEQIHAPLRRVLQEHPPPVDAGVGGCLRSSARLGRILRSHNQMQDLRRSANRYRQSRHPALRDVLRGENGEGMPADEERFSDFPFLAGLGILSRVERKGQRIAEKYIQGIQLDGDRPAKIFPAYAKRPIGCCWARPGSSGTDPVFSTGRIRPSASVSVKSEPLASAMAY